jgi:RND family efflux transporter MFP subunit
MRGARSRESAPRARREGAGVRLTAILLAGAAVAGCRAKAGAQQQAPIARIHVDTAEVREQPMPRTLALTGTLRGQRQTDLAANAMGRVLETFVERGAEVKKGDLLARLDTRAAAGTSAEAQANAALARAQRDTSKRECERYEALLAQKAISPAEYDRVADQCKSSPLALAAAEARARNAAQVVGDGQIRAPFGGIVTERWTEAGEYVRQDTKVVSLVSIDVLRLEFTVAEASIAAVKQGGTLTFAVPAYPGRTFTGTVRYVGAAVRETTRDLVAEAEVDNADRALRPGMFAAIELAAGEAPMPVVPASSVVTRDGTRRVFAVVDRRVEERVIQPGPTSGDVVAVVRGLKQGDKVVQKPAATLQNGQAVE